MRISSEPNPADREEFIPLSVPEIRGNEWKYVKECLDTGWVSSVGSFVDRFERMVADRVGREHAVATVNGTAALHTALLVAGVEPDDEVLVPTLTFIAPANAIRYVGAWPVFVDVESSYWQIDPELVVSFLDHDCRWAGGELRNAKTGRRVKAILPVDVLGHPCDMDQMLEVASKYSLAVIEDATESLGAQYKGRPVGRSGHVACYSFNGNKLITTGGGGMLVTDDEAMAHRAKYLTTQAKDDPVEFIHGACGYNYRLTNVQAAIGCAQLEQLNGYIVAKRRIASVYSDALASVPGLTLMAEAPWAFSVYWMYTILVDSHTFGVTSRDLLRRLQQAGIQTRPLWQPLHLSKPYAHCQVVGREVAESLCRTGLSLPCSVGLAPDQQSRVIRAVQAAARPASAG